jgi:hypothetical protein
MTDSTYYQTEIQKLTDLTAVTVKFNDYSGNSTKYMQLNAESAKVLIEFLTNNFLNK